MLPNLNLVSNVGWDEDATHTSVDHGFGFLRCGEMPFPLIHPSTVIRDREADLRTNDMMFAITWRRKLKRRVYRNLRQFRRA